MKKLNRVLQNSLLNIFLIINIFTFFLKFINIEDIEFNKFTFIFKINALFGLTLILLSRFNVLDLILLFSSFLLSLVIRDGNILMLSIISILVKNKNIEKHINFILKIYISFLFLIILFHFTGLIDNIDLDTLRYDEKTNLFHKRYSLGFINPNTFFLNLLPIYTVYIFNCYEEWKIKNTLLILITSGFFYYLTKSRTVFISLIIIILLIHIKNIFSLKIIKNIFPILTILSILSGKYLVFNEKIIKITSKRVILWNHFSDFGNFSFLSQKINLYENLSTHNLFLYILNRYGIFFYLIIMYIYIKILDKSLFLKKEKWIVVITLNLLVGFFEDGILLFPINIIIIYFYNFLLNKDNENKNIEDNTN